MKSVSFGSLKAKKEKKGNRTVTDDLVDGGTDRPGEAVVVERRGVPRGRK